MVKTSIVLTFILFALVATPCVIASGESISFQYPSQANYEQTFSASVSLINFSSSIYDVKIDILNSSYGRISQILSAGTWKSTFYYVLAAINTSQSNSSSFDLKITQSYVGAATINVTIRRSSTYKFGPYPLDVAQPQQPSQSSN